jgi:hypothetical protein
MSEEEEITQRWLSIHRDLRHSRTREWMEYFAFDREEIVHETLSGFNHRTFPQDHRWRDREDEYMIWRRSGLYTFDFKGRNLRGHAPSGIRHLTRRMPGGMVVTLKVQIIRAFLQSPAAVGDAVEVGNDRVVYSKNCGRAVLACLHVYITSS